MTPHASKGFTLIELLVVLVILGIVVAMIAVNFAPDPRQNLDTEARRLALLLEQARDEAMTSGSSIAFSAEGRSYRFLQRGPVGPDGAFEWREHGDGEVFRPRLLPQAVTFGELRVNGQPVASDAQRIVFRPSGMALPFRLTLASDQYLRTIGGDTMGRIAVEQTP